MGNNWFRFKQFTIEQEKAALKVGTDGVLLGAWTPLDAARTVLDVGSGTGLIALMLAQRSPEIICDAIELDLPSAEEAARNFANAPSRDRLAIHCGDFNHFASICGKKYDLIVSNPPFFSKAIKSDNPAVSLARHDDALSFSQLLAGSKRLLGSSGRLAVILPSASFDEFRELARLDGFYLKHKTGVVPVRGGAEKRIMLEYSVVPCYPDLDQLVLREADRQYTTEYMALTADFYLSF
ncbi:MAG: methyltransferase [Marinilabiliales bacterium]|nr:methyltransferase [Marinilabiliales bacterium]